MKRHTPLPHFLLCVHGPSHTTSPLFSSHIQGRSKPQGLCTCWFKLLSSQMLLTETPPAPHRSPWLRVEPLSPLSSLGSPLLSSHHCLKQEGSSSPAYSYVILDVDVPTGTGEHRRPGTEAALFLSLTFPIWAGSPPPKAITVP